MRSLLKSGFYLKSSGIFLIAFFLPQFIWAQAESYQPSQIISPSPTVAGLMKFEETPVNNYTGIPDISIPLYSVGTHSKDITIDLSLRYHPSSIAIDEEASYTGLGWSIFAGGTISRTVLGMPDEYSYTNQYGIHDGANNPYFEAISFIGPTASTDAQDVLRRFIWDAQVKGKYDTEHDLYQYNFMGHSGRFILTNECTLAQPCYKIVKLDNDNAISIVYNQTNKSFTIFDDNGYEYTFDVKEITTSGSFSNITYFDGSSAPSGGPSYTYTSAFQLSRIKDRQGNALADFTYNDILIRESTPSGTTTINYLDNSPQHLNTIGDLCPNVDAAKVLEPKMISSVSPHITDTKKLVQIDVKDIATINFTMEGGRSDFRNPGAYRLKSILVKNKRNDTIKNIELFHGYSEIKSNPLTPEAGFIRKRMILTKVSEYYDDKTLSYEMSYLKRKEEDASLFFKDYWGYITAKPSYAPAGDFKETHPFYCKMDVLQKMSLPTGGSVVYLFEPNAYSHIGETPVEDFGANPFNWTRETDAYPMAVTPTSHTLRFSEEDQNVVFSSSSSGITGSLYKKINGLWVQQYNFSGEYVLQGWSEYKLTMGGTGGSIGSGHYIGTSPNDVTPIVGGAAYVTYFFKKTPEKKYLFGGGIRLAKVGYFEDWVHQLYYEADENLEYYTISYKDNIIPVKEKKYNYNFFEDSNKSSGSLVFAKPIFDYSQTVTALIRCQVGNEGQGTNVMDKTLTFSYDSYTDFNNLKPVRTHGADVGYKNVTVSETGNGFSRFEYKSPIDVPESSYAFSPPFLPTSNRDNQRGFVLNEKHFNEGGQILQEVANLYNVVKGEAVTGLQVWGTRNCPFMKFYNDYDGYVSEMEFCATVVNPSPNVIELCARCDLPLAHMGYQLKTEEFAWPQLTTKMTTKYFYDENNIRQAFRVKDSMIYYPINKKIMHLYTETYSGGAIEKSRSSYSYAELPNNNISGIYFISQGTTTGTNNVATSYSVTRFQRTTLEPYTANINYVYKTKNGGPAYPLYQKRSFYNYENPNWITKEDGTNEAYIWGYNSTLPIAVVNTSYAGIMNPATLQVNEAIAASNNGDETELLAKLTALRAALPDYMVTTYTYKPLVGITSVTDPRGYKTSYEYDEFHRLKKVTDAEGNIISEHSYNYKNQ